MFDRLRLGGNTDRSSDANLQRAAALGQKDAIAALYRRHGALIYRFSLRMCQDTSIAEEVTQEVFLALIRQQDRYDASRAALSTWLCGIARRQVWKHLERQQRHLAVELFDLNEEGEDLAAESNTDDPSEMLTRKEVVEAVRRGLDELPAQLKEVIVLCELEEMTYDEAALIVAVPVGTIRSRLHRAKARLRMLLSREPVNGMKENSR